MSLEIWSWRPCHDPIGTIHQALCGGTVRFTTACLEWAAERHKYRFGWAVKRPFSRLCRSNPDLVQCYTAKLAGPAWPTADVYLMLETAVPSAGNRLRSE